MRVISPTQHAMLDYGVAATFLTMAARYRDSNRAAARLALVNGAMVLGVSLFTDYPGGVWRKLSFKTHGILDGVQAALAGLGPVLFGFADQACTSPTIPSANSSAPPAPPSASCP